MPIKASSEGLPRDVSSPWNIVPPIAIALLVSAWHLATFIPSITHPDALNYIGSAMGWARGEYALPVLNPLTYVGWERSIALLPSATTPVEVMRLFLDAKLLSIAFGVAAAVGLYLVAKRMFGSVLFAALTAVLFAANPYVWFSSQGAMSDLPSLAFMPL